MLCLDNLKTKFNLSKTLLLKNGIRSVDSSAETVCGYEISGEKKVQTPLKFMIDSHVCLENRLTLLVIFTFLLN